MKNAYKLIIGAGVIISAVMLFIPKKSAENTNPPSTAVSASTVAERLEYFASHGWEAEEIGSRRIIIPQNFSDSYEEYAEIQDKQGLPLRKYAGKEAEIFTYNIKNYSPESKNLLAELIVCDSIAVASLIYSEDGGSLKMPVC